MKGNNFVNEAIIFSNNLDSRIISSADEFIDNQ